MTPPTVTIQATLSREGLLEVREAIDALLGELGGSESNDHVSKRLGHNADRKVGEVWARVGKNARRFLATAAQRTGDGDEFTMNDVADWLGRDPKTVRSWHRNLGRTLKHVDAAIPEPRLMEVRWDGQRNAYRFPSAVREAILQRDMPIAPE